MLSCVTQERHNKAASLVTHGALLRAVWGPGHTQSRPYLHVFIGQLRRKIEPDAGQRRLILTEPGVGYRLAEAIE